MDLQAFFMERVEKPSEEEVIVSGRFPAFRLRGISEEENGQIRAGCRRKDGSIDPDACLQLLDAYLAGFTAKDADGRGVCKALRTSAGRVRF